jgi:hypothetical protein
MWASLERLPGVQVRVGSMNRGPHHGGPAPRRATLPRRGDVPRAARGLRRAHRRDPAAHACARGRRRGRAPRPAASVRRPLPLAAHVRDARPARSRDARRPAVVRVAGVAAALDRPAGDARRGLGGAQPHRRCRQGRCGTPRASLRRSRRRPLPRRRHLPIRPRRQRRRALRRDRFACRAPLPSGYRARRCVRHGERRCGDLLPQHALGHGRGRRHARRRARPVLARVAGAARAGSRRARDQQAALGAAHPAFLRRARLRFRT